MAFYGKKWQKSDFENVLELMDKLEVPEKTRALLRQTESISTFLNNGDGSIQYVVTVGDKEIINQNIVLDEEKDFKTPDGIDTKNTFTREGETLKSVMKFPDGKVLHLDREFGADKMILHAWLEGLDLKANVTYLNV
ncbi:uncharacterized protein LOC133529226 [Cydia pomonella]|uniref:uncharacterized protein LOC133529226 n=1 Tax=Cydia pomonella TaxID=82600 RepID=UPI002ADE47BE|nr:uncharacterized protein LOC133529226 [Cydia pomonella]